ncbi:MAG: hypothetical protein FWC67_05240 [Defluviitaleaceae bacterium]|nr:hypothetical protein [Defluviitaleaceae bacterium]
MKKLLLMLLILIAIFALAACGRGENEEYHEENGYGEMTQTYREWTAQELGATIVAYGNFWEDWWSFRGAFGFENIDWELWMNVPDAGSFAVLMPSSGFSSLDDIYDYLSQYYIEPDLRGRFFEDGGFVYMDVTRAGLARPNWATAQHTITEQEAGRAVVETRVLWGGWHRAPYHQIRGWEVLYRFEFVDGKIYYNQTPHGIDGVERTLPLSIEELGSTIVESGWFWDTWQGNFAHQHMHTIYENGYASLMPTSGFDNLQDVRDRLAQIYTARWIDEEFSAERPTFIEQAGRLYVLVPRPTWDDAYPRPYWPTATHVLIEQDGSRSVVETTVLVGSTNSFDPHMDGEPRLMSFRFVLIDGYIDIGPGSQELGFE